MHTYPIDPAIAYQSFKQFILTDFHPCVMARSAFSAEQVELKVYEQSNCPAVNTQLLNDLKKYVGRNATPDSDFYSFIAVFPNEQIISEINFEKMLWDQLSALHAIDPLPWDKRVSTDPADKTFSFSLLGEAFYIVGMHPASSRMARQAPMPCIVFNLHAQFEKLREMGVYHRVRNRIRRRDKKLQGSINPMLQDFGKRSEARQYSGRAVGEDWVCPFQRVNKKK